MSLFQHHSEGVECRRCGYKWVPNYCWNRKAGLGRRTPKKCARCKSPLWNKPRQKSGYGSKYSEAAR